MKGGLHLHICCIGLVRHFSISLLALLRSSINAKFSRQRYQPATQITLSLRKVLPGSLNLRLSLIKSLSIGLGHSRTPLTQLYLLFAMAQQMLREADEQARRGEALGKIEPYYNNLYKQKIFFGRFGPRMVSINGTHVPPGLAKLILKGIDVDPPWWKLPISLGCKIAKQDFWDRQGHNPAKIRTRANRSRFTSLVFTPSGDRRSVSLGLHCARPR